MCSFRIMSHAIREKYLWAGIKVTHTEILSFKFLASFPALMEVASAFEEISIYSWLMLVNSFLW